MNTMKFRLMLDVEFDPQGCSGVDLRSGLHQVIRDAVNNGTLTGDLPATVESYNYSIKLVKPPKRGRRCSITTSKNMRYKGVCRNLATHEVLSYGQRPFLVCKKHLKSFSKQYRTRPLKKLKRYPIQKILEDYRNRPSEPPSKSEPHQVLTPTMMAAIL